jgi:NAD(P)-dependent dehydrogenase (short-subunit alcohol dehydrogenase family)
MDSLVEKKNNKDLNNKIIIITGASSGLGFQIAKSLSNYNSKIIICSRNIEKIKRKFALKKNVILKKVDVQKPNEIKKFINFVLKRYKKIDILINNAGIAKNIEIEKIDYKLTNNVFKTNLLAPFLFIKYSIPVMKKNNFGRIVNISSAGSINCAPGYSLYSASKAGLNTLAKSASNELTNFNIKINTLSPGPIKTPMFPKNKLSTKLCIPTLKYLCALKKNGPTGKFFWFMRQVKIIPSIKLNWGNPPNND